MPTITPSDLQQIRSENPATDVIDVRTPVEYRSAHATGARNIPLDSITPSAFPQDQPVYILCQSGGRATRAAEQLAAAGHTKAIVVEGGTQAWIAAGLPVTRGKGNVIGLERQVRIAAGSLVLTGFLLGWFVHPYFFFLSGFVGAGLIFAGITDWCGMGLLLAKAPWNK